MKMREGLENAASYLVGPGGASEWFSGILTGALARLLFWNGAPG